MLIRPVLIEELQEQGTALFAAHHKEVGLDVSSPDLHLPLAIDWGVFRAIERADLLLALGLFCQEPNGGVETLVGYAVGTLSSHQFAVQRICSACGLYIAPPFRRGGLCRRLMDQFEAEAKELGAVTHWHAKEGSRFASILAARGARPLETVYVAR